MLLLLLPLHAMAQFAWYGENGKAKVNTGLGNGTNTEGTWFTFNEKADGGNSDFLFDSPHTTDNLPNDAHVQKYKSISGVAKVERATADYTNVGLGFYVVGKKKDADSYEEGDASKWDGIAIEYKSDIGFTVQLGLDPEFEKSIRYAVPEFRILAADTETLLRIPWSSFRQPDWYDSNLTGDAAAQRLVSIRFATGGKDGQYKFKITKIGSFNMPEIPTITTGITSPAVAADNDNWYTVSGVQLQQQPTTRGVYIHNGGKVVIK
jgi:hypothetical protein